MISLRYIYKYLALNWKFYLVNINSLLFFTYKHLSIFSDLDASLCLVLSITLKPSVYAPYSTKCLFSFLIILSNLPQTKTCAIKRA